MLNLTLQRNDSIETVLPTVERAMRSGELCRLHNINYLGQLQLAALILLAMSQNLMDTATGQIFQPHPGFRLVGIDDQGVTRTLAR